MASFFLDNQDLRFYVERGIDWRSLYGLLEDGYEADEGFASLEEAKETYRDILEMVGAFIADDLDPKVAGFDREGIRWVDGEIVQPEGLDEIFERIAELGLHGMCLPRELGGLNCPLLLFMITNEIFARADCSTMMHFSFHAAIAMALLVYSIHEGSTVFDESGRIESTRFREVIEDIVKNGEWGSMDITEPDAGSDMAALTTKAEEDETGAWFVTGNKIFITSGHGKYHVVIARTEPEQSLRSLSTFLVPAVDDRVTVSRIEEKLGLHTSATCAVSFERAPAELIGARGDGFKQMLLLMNNARIGVGFECIGICEAALRLALSYADERRAFGKPIAQHEMIADLLDEMEVDVLGLRALAMEATFHEEMSYRLDVDRRRRPSVDAKADASRAAKKAYHEDTSRRLTPLLKYLGSEKAVEMARRCMQIHGGSGYTTEVGAEKLLRDALIMPVYEGTSQIQSLMAMKDTLNLRIKEPTQFLRQLATARWNSLSHRDERMRRLARVQLESLSIQQHLLQKTAWNKWRSVRQEPVANWVDGFTKNWDPKRDFSYAMLHAERMTRVLCDEAICELLYAQGEKHSDRMWIFDRYVERAELRCRHTKEVIVSSGARLLETLADPGSASAAE
jgi:3-(methylthio)propanoyl-CoA dehydrogenase